MKIVAIIQARMASTRLPGKVLRELAGKPMLEHVIDRVKNSQMTDEIVIATSRNEKDERIVELAKLLNVIWFAGSEEDVLDRYLKAAEQVAADIVVRITGDCPLVDPHTIDRIVRRHIKLNVDYTRTLIDQNNSRSFPRGLDTEVFSINVLRKVDELAKKPREREHVTIFIYEHPKMFKIKIIGAEESLQRSKYRLCVDVEEDLRLITEIYNRLYIPSGIIDINEAIKLLDNNLDLQKINAHVKQR
jgi:spore coat polysaccharide biosynthesis protein SpsF